MRNVSSRCSGFTLVEMSAVLVIIALVVGGIFEGESLIHAATIRTVITDVNNYRSATSQFKSQYRYLPGDMPNVTTYWATATNGNGDGVIESATGDSDPDHDIYTGERPQFFVQLGLAGLTKPFDGSTTLGAGYPKVAINDHSGMFVVGPWQTSSGSNINNFTGYAQARVYLYMGICNPAVFGSGTSAFNDCAVFTPTEAYTIDRKIDDGLPLSGTVLGESYNTTCVIGNAANNYDVTSTTAATVNAGCNMLVDLTH